MKRGQKLAIVGLNGTGKSTLLKAIAEEIPFITGGARLGSQVKLGYFDQHHKNLDPRNTVYQQIQAVIPMAPKQDVLGFLAKFQFRGDDVDKPVTVLSGGERARLSVATLIREGVNLLLLDEPTNHMDIHSMEAMEDTILSFTGAAIVVTHDRYLLGRVADSLLRVHDNKAEFREGGYEEHQAWVDLDIGQEPEEGPEAAGDQSQGSPSSRRSPPKSAAPPKARAHRQGEAEDHPSLGAQGGRGRSPGGGTGRLGWPSCPRSWPPWTPWTGRPSTRSWSSQKALETELAYAMTEWEESQTALEGVQGGS